jgi:hypothetical protein
MRVLRWAHHFSIQEEPKSTVTLFCAKRQSLLLSCKIALHLCQSNSTRERLACLLKIVVLDPLGSGAELPLLQEMLDIDLLAMIIVIPVLHFLAQRRLDDYKTDGRVPCTDEKDQNPKTAEKGDRLGQENGGITPSFLANTVHKSDSTKQIAPKGRG